jgi:hypothetical protein
VKVTSSNPPTPFPCVDMSKKKKKLELLRTKNQLTYVMRKVIGVKVSMFHFSNLLENHMPTVINIRDLQENKESFDNTYRAVK